MKALLAKLTFARAMIFSCLVGSGVLGVLIWQNQVKIRAQAASLATEGDVASLVRKIQAASKRYTKLYQARGDEKLRAQDNPQTYITAIAADPKVRVGRVEIKVDSRQLTPTVTDRIYTVTPFLREEVYSRGQIANFLWKLEYDSRRVRVTELTMTALDANNKPRVNPDDYPSDKWSFTCKVTSRQKLSEGGSP